MIRFTQKHNEDQRRILVLGASGFIGRWVARVLSQAGVDVHMAVRDLSAFEDISRSWGIQGEVHCFDATESNGLAALLEESRPASILNLIGYGVDRSEKDEGLAKLLNAEFPSSLAHACHAYDPQCSLIHIGSALEYGQQEGDLNEETTPNPDSLYGRTKLAGSQAIMAEAASGLNAIVARVFTVFGPGEHEQRLLPSLRRAAQNQETVDLSDGLQKRDFAYVEDVAHALAVLSILPRYDFSVFNLGTGVLCSVREFILTASRVLKLPKEHLNFGAISRYADEMQHEPVHVGRCQQLLGAALSPDIEHGVVSATQFEEDLA